MTSLSEQITLLEGMLATAKTEVKALEGGKKSSSTRARKSLQNVKNASHVMRKNIITHTRSIPTKTRVTRPVVEATNTEPEPEPELESEPAPEPPKLVRSMTEAKPKSKAKAKK